MEFPSPVKNYHRDTYPAIDPTSSRLSTAGKNIVITGGGAGIGVGLARSFAQSGASSISILGRTEKTLLNTKSQLEKEYPKTKIFIYVADIVNKNALITAFESINSAVGPVHVLVANAGFLPNLNPVAKADLEDWYNGFEVNVKGNFNVVTAFVPVAASDAAIISISTGITHLKYLPGYSGYHTSKLAAAKFFEYVHHEFPQFFVLNVHPGVIMTASKYLLQDVHDADPSI
ncbi:hypothetical protein ONS95_004519 [Cadophora gregata]|uniref:uncharacterized protein n=1 Tax=Cadophora gregata TaxID=51156 RepID=UPI0026DAA055|nr:uncharacterized protein ONS95_004519 [Cadophora gregata]KAK0106012.1 hypothetical protein ONS95_004519 [Cadophora gregata]